MQAVEALALAHMDSPFAAEHPSPTPLTPVNVVNVLLDVIACNGEPAPVPPPPARRVDVLLRVRGARGRRRDLSKFSSPLLFTTLPENMCAFFMLCQYFLLYFTDNLTESV